MLRLSAAAAAPGAEDPSADRQRLYVVEREFSHRTPIPKRSGLGKSGIM
jgi:hypothetical protein